MPLDISPIESVHIFERAFSKEFANHRAPYAEISCDGAVIHVFRNFEYLSKNRLPPSDGKPRSCSFLTGVIAEFVPKRTLSSMWSGASQSGIMGGGPAYEAKLALGIEGETSDRNLLHLVE